MKLTGSEFRRLCDDYTHGSIRKVLADTGYLTNGFFILKIPEKDSKRLLGYSMLKGERTRHDSAASMSLDMVRRTMGFYSGDTGLRVVPEACERRFEQKHVLGQATHSFPYERKGQQAEGYVLSRLVEYATYLYPEMVWKSAAQSGSFPLAALMGFDGSEQVALLGSVIAL